jgi:hypothetical protein
MQDLMNVLGPFIATRRSVIGVLVAGILGLLIGLALGLCFMTITAANDLVVLWKITVTSTLVCAACGITLRY